MLIRKIKPAVLIRAMEETTERFHIPLSRRRRSSGVFLALLFGMLLHGPVAMSIEDGQQFEDWRTKCEKLPDDQGEQCFIFQTLIDEEAKQAVLQTVVGYLGDGKAQQQPAIIFTVPLGVALRAGIGVKIDDGEVMRIPYENCNPVGCVAGMPLDDKVLAALKRGLKSTVFVHDGAGRRISLEVSLKGFTAGFNALR